MRICLKYRPANIGDSRQGNIHQDDIEIQKLIARSHSSLQPPRDKLPPSIEMTFAGKKAKIKFADAKKMS
jgi:hypothetical protein